MNPAHASVSWGPQNFSSMTTGRRDVVRSLETTSPKKSYDRPRLTLLADFAEPEGRAIEVR